MLFEKDKSAKIQIILLFLCLFIMFLKHKNSIDFQ